MDTMNEKLREYAKLLIEVGLHVQKGQTLVISSPVECAFFARLCASAAYDVGCREVVMNWHDDYLAREKFLRADDAVFDEVPRWRQHFFNDYAKAGAAYLAIDAEDPEHLKGVDPDRRVRALRVSGQALKEYYRLQMSSGFPWCIASIPIPSWAKQVFPDVPEEQAMEQLWDAIFKAVRITGDGRSVEHWQEHIAMLARRKEKLNALRLKTLHYTNSLGTDLTVELPADHIWEAGDDCTSAGQPFVANMPTEEIFTAPLRTGVNGVVVRLHALWCTTATSSTASAWSWRTAGSWRSAPDRGRRRWRRPSPWTRAPLTSARWRWCPTTAPSPIRSMLFYNTLFDENAACHIAFGEAYPCIEGGRDMTKEELKARGLNDSITHVDFMVGTADLSIIGTTQDGREVPVFVNGNFAI